MRILKTEVKSIYEIAVSADDFAKAKNEWNHNDTLNIRFPKAFKDDNVGHMSVLEEMKNNTLAHGDKAGCLAHCLGFDGWENAGYFDERIHCIRMTVFNYGDRLN